VGGVWRAGIVLEMAAKIFLAHAREDKAQVRKLYADLRARGFDPWLDEKDLRAGQTLEGRDSKSDPRRRSVHGLLIQPIRREDRLCPVKSNLR
jgi:hypothetical protein